MAGLIAAVDDFPEDTDMGLDGDPDDGGPGGGLGRGCASDFSVWLGTVTAEMVLLGHMGSSESSANDDSLLTIASRHNSLDRAA